MKKTTNEIIQTFAKIGQIFSKIIYICCIIGSIGCLIAIVSLSIFSSDTIQIGGITLHSIIEHNADASVGSIITASIIGFVLCLSELFLAKMANNYFIHELEIGTPFDFSLSNELKRLGINTICISIGASVVVGILYSIMSSIYMDVEELDLDFSSVSLGLMFIVTSFICKLGAEKTTPNITFDTEAK